MLLLEFNFFLCVLNKLQRTAAINDICERIIKQRQQQIHHTWITAFPSARKRSVFIPSSIECLNNLCVFPFTKSKALFIGSTRRKVNLERKTKVLNYKGRCESSFFSKMQEVECKNCPLYASHPPWPSQSGDSKAQFVRRSPSRFSRRLSLLLHHHPLSISKLKLSSPILLSAH